MTYQEKINKLLENRGLALSSLSSAYKEEENKEEELDFYYTYLFGSDGNSIGVITILELFYKELNLGIGRTTTRPALQGGAGTSTSSWIAAFNAAVGTNGDDVSGFYPPDGNNIGAIDFNEDSNYLKTNDDQGEINGGIVGFSLDAMDAIGSVATLGPHLGEPSTSGSGILGKRTEDNLPEDQTDPLNIIYGDGEPDNPNWYNNPYKGSFETALEVIITSLGTYKAHLELTRNRLEYIANGSHEVFEESSMSNDMPLEEVTNLSSLETTIQGHIDDLQAELDYFSGFEESDNIAGQDGYNKVDFDTKLNTIVPTLLTSIISTLQGREAAVKTAINYGNTNGNFRKWIVFWIKQAIGKFNGPLISLDGIKNNVIPGAVTSLRNANQALDVMFGNTFEEYLLTPSVFATFYNPEINEETGEVIKKRAGMVWMANLAANRYNIYRRNISNLNSLLENNIEWEQGFIIKKYIDLNDSGSMIKSDYLDEDLEIQNGGKFIYRIQTLDTDEEPKSWNRLDSVLNQNTSSKQSKIIGKTYNIASINGNIIELTENIDNSFGLCFIENKYYGVLKAKEKKIVLSESLEINSPFLTEIIGGVFIP